MTISSVQAFQQSLIRSGLSDPQRTVQSFQKSLHEQQPDAHSVATFQKQLHQSAQNHAAQLDVHA